MRSRRVLITGLATHWGGKLAQAIERDPEIETIIGVDAEDPRVELERTEYVRVGTQHALLRRIVMAAEIDTVIDSRLVVDSTAVSAGVAHENNVIGTMNILVRVRGRGLPGAPGGLQVDRALVRLRAGRPGLLHRGHAPPAPAEHQDRARRRRGRGRRLGLRRPPPRRLRRDPALHQRARRRRRHGAHALARPARHPGDPRLRPPLPVHPRGRRRGLPRARGAREPRRDLQLRGRRRARALRGRRPARQAAAAGPAAVGDVTGHRGTAPHRPGHPPRDAQPDALWPRPR